MRHENTVPTHAKRVPAKALFQSKDYFLACQQIEIDRLRRLSEKRRKSSLSILKN
jgi:hypothetical protein